MQDGIVVLCAGELGGGGTRCGGRGRAGPGDGRGPGEAEGLGPWLVLGFPIPLVTQLTLKLYVVER
eukprot:2485800-Prymnesium_polylepis.1